MSTSPIRLRASRQQDMWVARPGERPPPPARAALLNLRSTADTIAGRAEAVTHQVQAATSMSQLQSSTVRAAAAEIVRLAEGIAQLATDAQSDMFHASRKAPK